MSTDSIDAPVGPERLHLLPGLYNLRDTGGYRAAAGVTRWGKLLRSDALHQIDDSGRARLAEVGIAHIVDLRGEGERQSAPSLIEGLATEVHHIPVFDDAAPPSPAAALAGLAPIYDHIVDERGAQLVAAIRVIAAAGEDEAVLVHCTAGKDRTGIVIALALSAAGVERSEVVADYALTSDNLRGAWADAMLDRVARSGQELTPAIVELISASPAAVMDALLERIEREHGSAAQYLRAHGLRDDELERLTAALVA